MSEYSGEIIRMEGISKSFPGVQALSGINLSVRPSSVHALIGENGAGKVHPHKSTHGRVWQQL